MYITAILHLQSGITLELLPMLIGFFTYKIAVLARETKELMAQLSPQPTTDTKNK
jgi:hypothetical protein